MPTIVERDGMTIEINPIPTGKLGIGKRPEGGVLKCDRCGCEEAQANRDENGWELWWLLQRYADLCPACVPVALGIWGKSCRIPSPQFLSEAELEARRDSGTPDNLWSYCDGGAKCPDCGTKTAIVDVSGIHTDPATVSKSPTKGRDRLTVHAIYCPTCDDILSTRLGRPRNRPKS
jgi:hypothetical protein